MRIASTSRALEGSALFLALALASFGGCEAEIIEPTAAEQCEAADGVWRTGNCGGGDDQCALIICEQVVGEEGCHCDAPGECWDGEACVQDPKLAFEACGDAYRSWAIGCDEPTCCGDALPCWSGLACVSRATFDP